ncbi:MAG: dolichyl-phosphate beta-glucosyltransferase [archaeon]
MKPKPKRELSLVIPAYNEEKRLAGVLQSYHDYLSKNFSAFELIVVPNNCSDSTPKIALDFAKKHRNTKVINIPHYVGKGGAVIRGFKAANLPFVGFTDADTSVTPKEFGKIFSGIEGYDCAIGSRALPESVIPVKQPMSRIFFGLGFRLLVNILFGLGIKDTQCGAKVFRAGALKKVISELKLSRWEFDVELLWKLKRNGAGIKEVPIAWVDDKNSKLNFRDVLDMFFGILKLRFLYK